MTGTAQDLQYQEAVFSTKLYHAQLGGVLKMHKCYKAAVTGWQVRKSASDWMTDSAKGIMGLSVDDQAPC